MKIYKSPRDAKSLALNELKAVDSKVLEVKAQPKPEIIENDTINNQSEKEEKEDPSAKKARKKKKEADV